MYVDHVDHIGLAMSEARQGFQGDTDVTRAIVVITDKQLNDSVKCKFLLCKL